jgi:hypothetical protein
LITAFNSKQVKRKTVQETLLGRSRDHNSRAAASFETKQKRPRLGDDSKKPAAKSVTQSTLSAHTQHKPGASARLHLALAELCHANGLAFGIPSCREMKLVLTLARQVGESYKPPGRNEVGGTLLESNYSTHKDTQMATLASDLEVYGVALYGDGATIKKMPLVNVLASGAHNTAAVLEIHDCSGHCSQGKKKGAVLCVCLLNMLLTFDFFYTFDFF